MKIMTYQWCCYCLLLDPNQSEINLSVTSSGLGCTIIKKNNHDCNCSSYRLTYHEVLFRATATNVSIYDIFAALNIITQKKSTQHFNVYSINQHLIINNNNNNNLAFNICHTCATLFQRFFFFFYWSFLINKNVLCHWFVNTLL